MHDRTGERASGERAGLCQEIEPPSWAIFPLAITQVKQMFSVFGVFNVNGLNTWVKGNF